MVPYDITQRSSLHCSGPRHGSASLDSHSLGPSTHGLPFEPWPRLLALLTEASYEFPVSNDEFPIVNYQHGAVPTPPFVMATPLRSTSIRNLNLLLRTAPRFVQNQFRCQSTATSSSSSSSVNPEEVSHFNALASQWWNPQGSSRLLHLMNPLRHDFIRTCLPHNQNHLLPPTYDI